MPYSSEKLKHLLEANRILSSTLNLPELLRQVLRLATDVVDAETSSLLLYDREKNDLRFDLALGEKEPQLKQIRLKMGEGIAGAAAQERTAQIVNNVESDVRWAKAVDTKTQFQTRSVLAVPLLCRGELLGVVEAINKRSGDFTREDADLFEAFAGQAAISLENARVFECLQEEKDKIQAVFSQMSDGAIFVDRDGNKLLANRSASRLLGSENVKQEKMQDVLAGFQVQPPLADILSGKKVAVPFEFTRSASKTFCLVGTVTPIIDAASNTIGFIFIFRDATEEKKESILKRNFLALISHKLRTPLVAITGYGPLLLADDRLSDYHKKAVDSIHRQGKYLLGLVEKLLFFTLVEGDGIDLMAAPASFAVAVDQAVTLMHSFVEDRGAVVTISPSVGTLPSMVMDMEKIVVVVVNLIENAIKFNPGPVKNVEIRGRRDRGYAGIEVIDNGPGIPPEEREKIFLRFYQIEESFTGQVEGTGLGLALVKRVVDAHGGSVHVESTMGRGSTFVLMLPWKGTVL